MTNRSRATVSLSEDDYIAILNLISGLLSLTARRSLPKLLRSSLLPLLDASACFLAWADADLQEVHVVDAVGIPRDEFNTIQGYLPCSPLARFLVDLQSPVGAYDLDLPGATLHDSVEKFFEGHPVRSSRSSSYLDGIRTALLAIGHGEIAIVIGFHRRHPYPGPFVEREKRILEHLHPHLCQAAKTFLVNKEVDEPASTLQGESPEPNDPMAQVTSDSHIVEQNHEFRNLFRLQPGDPLDSSLTRLLEIGIRDFRGSSSTQNCDTGSLSFCHCPNLFQVNITRATEDLWRLRLYSTSDACSSCSLILKKHGLTPREREVCCRVRQGLDNQEIASRLFISLHTAKTHLKNIYQKLDIPSRPQLVSYLNQH